MKVIGKRIVVILFTVVLIISLAACGKSKQTDNTGKVTIAPTKEAEVTVTKAAPTKKAEPTIVEKQESLIASEPMEMRDITATDLVKEMTIGWNLGNTLDATGGQGVFTEMSWGNPITTKKMIDAVKAAGFNTLRIPTTWQPHIGPAPDYIIDQAWLDRVQEVVEYAYANDMFVIINMHHEEWYCPYYDKEDAIVDELTKTWKQIADQFQNYDEHLIFEGLNEPRQKGTSFEWNGGNQEGWDVVNKLNAAFVETIRKAGVNNPKRILMIPPYAANSSQVAWNSFEVPKDDKIIVSIHAYTPYNFALNKSGTDQWNASNASDTGEIDNLMKNINEKFISQGIPVILGEFGAMDKNGNTESRVAWAEYYVKKAKEVGIPCIWWDNAAFLGSGELFGLLDRYTATWKHQEVVDALMKGLQ